MGYWTVPEDRVLDQSEPYDDIVLVGHRHCKHCPAAKDTFPIRKFERSLLVKC